MDKGDVVIDADDDDDEVRTSASQGHATATLCIEEFFLRTQYIFVALPSCQQRDVGGGAGTATHIDCPG